LLFTIVIVDMRAVGAKRTLNIDLLLKTGQWLYAETKTRCASKAALSRVVDEVDMEK
jgi:hypothetical protein